MNEMEWHQMTFRYQGNLVWWAESEEGYYAKYQYQDHKTGYTVTHTVGPTLRKINATNAIKRHIDNRAVEMYGESKGDI